MNTLRNRVQLVGNLGQDPEVKKLKSGKSVATFSLATNETYSNAEGKKVTETQWHRLVAWDFVAEKVEKLLKKGNEVAIEGKLTSRSYEDKNGEKRYISEVVVKEVILIREKAEKKIEESVFE